PDAIRQAAAEPGVAYDAAKLAMTCSACAMVPAVAFGPRATCSSKYLPASENRYIRDGAADAHSHRAGGVWRSIDLGGPPRAKSARFPGSAYSPTHTNAPSAGSARSAGSGPQSP